MKGRFASTFSAALVEMVAGLSLKKSPDGAAARCGCWRSKCCKEVGEGLLCE